MAVLKVQGTVEKGRRHFTKRMKKHQAVFEDAVGEPLVRGTLNVRIPQSIQVREHFKIAGQDINEPEQDLLFEVCRVNGVWAYRIRPFQPATGKGGHGDDVIEITSNQVIPNAKHGSLVEIEFFR